MLEVVVYERVVVRADDENIEIMSSTDMHPYVKFKKSKSIGSFAS